jgi:hypothetical protein
LNTLSRYIASREGWDALLELEEVGAKIRDTDDEFKGAPFRDEASKLLFAYDYDNRVTLRIWGTTFKPAIAWRPGAEFTMMEKSAPAHPAGFHLPSYGSGNPENTWYPASMVDANGKEIPWVKGLDQPISQVDQRTHPAPGQSYFGDRPMNPKYKLAHLVDDLEARICQGEFSLPLCADLTNMPDYERRAIWGLMVGQERRTKAPIKERPTRRPVSIPKRIFCKATTCWAANPSPACGSTPPCLLCVAGGLSPARAAWWPTGTCNPTWKACSWPATRSSRATIINTPW